MHWICILISFQKLLSSLKLFHVTLWIWLLNFPRPGSSMILVDWRKSEGSTSQSINGDNFKQNIIWHLVDSLIKWKKKHCHQSKLCISFNPFNNSCEMTLVKSCGSSIKTTGLYSLIHRALQPNQCLWKNYVWQTVIAQPPTEKKKKIHSLMH